MIYANGAIETTIDGFHLTNGNAAGLGGNPLNDGDAGGGLYARDATISLLNGQVYSNTAVNGGGIFMTENIFSINDNQIFSNTASIGGGIHIYANDAGMIDGNEIYANDAPSGGGFFSRVLRDTTFSTNTVHDNYREGIYINGSTNTPFENNTIASNQGCGFYQRSGISFMARKRLI